jgi:hypothetical protein
MKKTKYETPQSEELWMQLDCMLMQASTGSTEDYSEADWSDLVS